MATTAEVITWIAVFALPYVGLWDINRFYVKFLWIFSAVSGIVLNINDTAVLFATLVATGIAVDELIYRIPMDI